MERKEADDQHTQIVKHFRLAQSGSKPKIIMSTDKKMLKYWSGCTKQRAARQGVLPRSTAMSWTWARGPRLPCEHRRRGEDRKSKGASNTYSNLAVNFVQITLPGPCRKRGDGLGGTEMSESSLLPKLAPKVAVFLQPMCQSLAIRTLAHMTVAVKEVVAQFEARSGHNYRNAVSGGDLENPCNVLEYVRCETRSHTRKFKEEASQRMRRMKAAGDSTGGQYGGRVMPPTGRTFENKRSGAIGVAGVAHGKSRRRSRKRVRRMKPARDRT